MPLDFNQAHPQAPKSSIVNKSLGDWVPGRSQAKPGSPARGQGSPSHGASRALPERVEFTRDSRRPAADAQTDRRRGAGRSPAAPESANQRRGGELLSPSQFCFCWPACSEAPESQPVVAPKPRGVLGSLPGQLVSVYAPSLRFKPGTFTCPGTLKNCMQNQPL